MEKTSEIKFEHIGLGKRLKTMLSVDFRRMFTTPLFYIMFGACLVMPVLILVMTTAMDGSVTTDPNTGAQTTIEAFTSIWQAIGSMSTDSSMDMSLTGMCNINLVYFMAAVLVCVFVSGDFRSGYCKNLFAVRSKKSDYVASKTLTGLVCSVLLLFAFFAGAMIGGAIAGLPFDVGEAGAAGTAMCMLSKIFLMAVFVPIYVPHERSRKAKALAFHLRLACRRHAAFYDDTRNDASRLDHNERRALPDGRGYVQLRPRRGERTRPE